MIRNVLFLNYPTNTHTQNFRDTLLGHFFFCEVSEESPEHLLMGYVPDRHSSDVQD